jgi:hypothetical protein
MPKQQCFHEKKHAKRTENNGFIKFFVFGIGDQRDGVKLVWLSMGGVQILREKNVKMVNYEFKWP